MLLEILLDDNVILFVFIALVILFAYFFSSFHFGLFALFLGLAAVSAQSGGAFLGAFFLLAAAIVALHWILSKSGQKLGKAGEKARSGLEKEWALIEKAKPQGGVGLKFWDESLHTLGKKSSEALMAKDGMKYSSPQPISRIAKGSQNFIDAFYKIFKK